MKKALSVICASMLATSLTIGEVQSAPMPFVPGTANVERNSNVIKVRDNVRWPNMMLRGDRQWNGGGNWHGNRGYWNGNRGYWRGNRGYWNGNRGYWNGNRHWRGGGWNGYYNGWNGYYNGWNGSGFYFGGGALLLGALVGTAIANSNYRGNYYGGNSHTQWCANRYRSYSPRSDTFQPYHGPRRRCISPY